ncbi:hypothetical protein CTAYLR_004157 [Chrysophaeum taylorii]|uniref:subtilisin n=1 Tax=Chrysophaeum taylorii TaxID=2483200 RepID=A0AAD7XP80_9STRA|nr:hypothetical protein CTAYLR_004157 [Chrysophaeum taylorii]
MRWAATLLISLGQAQRYFVRLCEEGHREGVARHVAKRHGDPNATHFSGSVSAHVKHLRKLPALVVDGTTEGAVAELRGLEAVCGVQRVGQVRALHSYARPVNDVWWNVDRINQDELPLDGDGSLSLTGVGASVFVLDTGLDATHAEFAAAAAASATSGWSREVRNVASFAEWEPWRYKESWGWTTKPAQHELDNNDRNGHGTHVSGTCCGATVGAAPDASLFHMKVLNDTGFGSTDWVLSALDAVAEVKENGKLPGPVIISMSLGGECVSRDPEYCSTKSMEALAIESLYEDYGVVTVAAAGNDGDDACYYSPAAAAKAVAAGATDVADRVASFSNYGACVDVMAPGRDIGSALSSRMDAIDETVIDDEYLVLSGTSMAAPLVAGVIAQFSEALPFDAVNATNAMLNAATRGQLTYDTNQGAGNTACASNDKLVRSPDNATRLETSSLDYHGVCELPSVRDDDGRDDFNFWYWILDDDFFTEEDDQLGDNVSYDAYATADVGYCAATIQRFVYGAWTAQQCWSACASRFKNLTAVDFQDPFWCYCRGDCECMLGATSGTTLVAEGSEIPARCSDAYDEYETDQVGWCSSALDQYEDGASSAAECWQLCNARHDGIVAVDFYRPSKCFCQNSCDCMESVSNTGGVTLVGAGAELPATCNDDDVSMTPTTAPPFHEYETTTHGWCLSDLNVRISSQVASPRECWDECSAAHGDIVVAVDWYSQTRSCWCQSNCTVCMPTMVDVGSADGMRDLRRAHPY